MLMKSSWSKTVVPIASIFSFRMLGLFLLIPVFSIYAEKLQNATPVLIGLALGGYGLTQGLLQMPFGLLSDRWGRKRMITLGLIFFAIGSLIGAWTDSIYGMILARTIQGTGAIGSVLIALMADLTPDEQRTQAMAVIGMTIGTSFTLAMVISPALTHYFGLSGIFYLCAILAILGIILLHGVIPTPIKECFHADSEANPSLLKPVLHNRNLQRLNIGIFCQHFILTSTFFAIPILLTHHIKQGHLSQQWHFYLPLMLFSFVLMIPFIVLAEKRKQIKFVFVLSVFLSMMTQLLLAFTCQDWFSLCLLMFVYFIAFNILEATLPSLISKQAHPQSKGTALGLYSTSQFLGIFAGGSLGGLLYQWHSNEGIFFINAVLGCIWLSVAVFMKPSAYISTLIFHYVPKKEKDQDLMSQLANLKGVKEVLLAREEQVAYVRVDKEHYVLGSAESILSKHQ